jgi:hypothetical protein
MGVTLWLIHFRLYEIKYFPVPDVAGILHRQLNHCLEWPGPLSQDHKSATWTSITAWAWRQILWKHEWNSGRSCKNHTIGVSNCSNELKTCSCLPRPAAWSLSRGKLLKFLAIDSIRLNDGLIKFSQSTIHVKWLKDEKRKNVSRTKWVYLSGPENASIWHRPPSLIFSRRVMGYGFGHTHTHTNIYIQVWRKLIS